MAEQSGASGNTDPHFRGGGAVCAYTQVTAPVHSSNNRSCGLCGMPISWHTIVRCVATFDGSQCILEYRHPGEHRIKDDTNG